MTFSFVVYATQIEIEIETQFRRLAHLNQNGFVTVILDSHLFYLAALTSIFLSMVVIKFFFLGLKKPP